MSNTFHRNLKQTVPVVVSGQGIYLTDAQGKRYIDACGGAAVACLGHSHPRITEAVHRQVDRLSYASTVFFTTSDAEALASHLAARSPGTLNWSFFASGGSEAIESAMKCARQYFVEIGQPQRQHFISRAQGYHGNTLGALSLSGIAVRRAPYLPILLPTTHHVSPCYAYRHQLPSESEEQFATRLADELEAKILEIGADKVIGFFAETVVGAALGCVPPVKTYFQKIRAVCDKYGVLLIIDEVMSGMGRTGPLFACEPEGIAPDILVMAKGLGGGYQPIGCMMVNARIHDALVNGSGQFVNGYTYTGHPLACAVALEVQKVIEEDYLLDNVKVRGAQLRARLEATVGQHPNVGNIRGRGLFQGIEFVADRASKTPFAPNQLINARIKAEAMQHGLLVYPTGGTADGVSGDHVILAPPYICTAQEIDEIADLFDATVNAVFAAL
ncbi:MAG: aspartate aminotransferase family protein [Chloroflexi bacterium]|nr:aspartate aminotransferase family protein [Chloroflexota bacterium]